MNHKAYLVSLMAIAVTIVIALNFIIVGTFSIVAVWALNATMAVGADYGMALFVSLIVSIIKTVVDGHRNREGIINALNDL